MARQRRFALASADRRCGRGRGPVAEDRPPARHRRGPRCWHPCALRRGLVTGELSLDTGSDAV